jgi:hypothetical protein
MMKAWRVARGSMKRLGVWCVCLLLLSCGQRPALAGRVRTYFIAADEVEWDYAPSGGNKITGEP